MFLFLYQVSHPSLSFPLGPSNFSLSSLQLIFYISLFVSFYVYLFLHFLRFILVSSSPAFLWIVPLRSYQSLANSSLLSTHLLSLYLFSSSILTHYVRSYISHLVFLFFFGLRFLSVRWSFYFVSLLYFFHEIPSVFLDAYNFLLLSLFLRSVDLISPHLCVRYLAPCLPTIVADSLRVTTSVSFMQLPMGRERV